MTHTSDQNVSSQSKSRKVPIIIGLILAIAGYTQLSIVTLGDERAGSTAVVLRYGELAQLDFIDSDSAACKRMGANHSGGAFGFSSAYFCEGRLAIIIADGQRALVRFSFSSALKKIAG